MKGWTYFPYELCGVVAGAAAVSVILSMRLARLVRRWRAKKPDEVEKLRRFHVNGHGRIASAEILDVLEKGPPENSSCVLVYRYQVAGVVYEAAQEVSNFPGITILAESLSGLEASVKYDPRKPANSIIACEEWSGLKPKSPAAINGRTAYDEPAQIR